jgi:hypothetical protein
MSTSGDWFDDMPVVGKLPPEEAVVKLREIGEVEAAEMLEMAEEESAPTFGMPGIKGWGPFQEKPWQYTAHTFGYLAAGQPGRDALEPLPISPIGGVKVDSSLQHARLKITLDRLRVAAYPGGGTHHILVHCCVQNQTHGRSVPVHFNATYRVREGQQAAIRGFPIFVGVNVGSEGLIFKCRTINVKNEQDEAFLSFLESDAFKSGLQLITAAQPVIAPFSEMALGLAKMVASRNRNVSVQDFELGLDFSSMPMGARLAEGAYLAVQIPESQQTVWKWSEWVYDPASGQVVNKAMPGQLIPYNYLVFSVSRYEGV